MLSIGSCGHLLGFYTCEADVSQRKLRHAVPLKAWCDSFNISRRAQD